MRIGRLWSCLLLAALASQALAGEGTIFVGSGQTASKPQSKLWHHDGTWWGVFLDGYDHYIYRKDGDQFVKLSECYIEDNDSAQPDVLWTGTDLFVLVTHGSTSLLRKFTYNPGARSWDLVPGFPVGLALGSRWDTATITQDTTGKLWVTCVDGSGVRVIWSTSADHRNWNQTGILLKTGVSTGDIAAICSFADRVGVMWSDQVAVNFAFRSHKDGDPDNSWGPTEIVSNLTGIADDHINLAVTPDDRILAATKDGFDQLNLFMRDPATGWEGPYEFTNIGTRPIVLYDTSKQEVHVFFSDTRYDPRKVAHRKAKIDALDMWEPQEEFLAVPGESLLDCTSTKQNVDFMTGALMAVREKNGSLVHWKDIDLSQGVGVPTVSVAASPTSGEAPLAVSFTSTAKDLDGTIVSYAWAFGDGASSTSPNPSHTYADAGFYTAQLTVTDNDGKKATAQVGILATAPGVGTVGPVLANVNFQPAGTPVPTGYLPDYGTPFDNSVGYGWKDVSLASQTRDLESTSDQRYDTIVFVENAGSPADWEFELPNGQYFVSLTAGASLWTGMNYVWVEGKQVLDGVYTASGEFVEVKEEPVTVLDGRLTVRIGGGTDDKKTKLCFLTIYEADFSGGGSGGGSSGGGGSGGGGASNNPPTATASASVTSGPAPLAVSFNGGGRDTDGTIVSYQWTFGDGGSSGLPAPDHTYADAGIYVATLTVTDDGGATATANVTITVTAPPSGSPGGLLAQINFQPASAPVPAGFVADNGVRFDSARGYGWDTTLDALKMDFNPDPLLDSYVVHPNSDTPATWQYNLPNGNYLVTLVAGSPQWGGVHFVSVEGFPVISGEKTRQSFVTVTDHPVSVVDGQLTVTIGNGSDNKKTKLCYLIIRSAD